MKCSDFRYCKMSADVDRSKFTIPFKMSGNEFWNASRNDRLNSASRHYSFSQEEKPYHPKRRNSEKYPPGFAVHGFRRRYARFGNRANLGRIVLPTKFLLGGNISDPLNLNSLCDEEINRSLNEFTPVSSPLPIPGHRLENKVPIIHPANIHDPLNLESNEDAKTLTVSPQKGVRARKRRHPHKRHVKTAEKSESKEEGVIEKGLMNPLSIHIDLVGNDVFSCPPSRDGGKNVGEFGAKKVIDKIVSPVIPQISPKWKRKRASSESRPDIGESVSAATNLIEKEKSGKNEKAAAIRSKTKRNSTNLPGFKSKDSRYVHGNYSTFHGYRTPVLDDSRLKMFGKDMFEGKDVLDIGCNVGHFTIGVAKKFEPRSIVGIDVDGKLIEAAKKNLRHVLSSESDAPFPVSFKILRGPLVAHPLMELKGSREDAKFPHNVTFRQENYFLECREETKPLEPQYDVILALRITKWIHLNYGDAGLKRCFRQMFRQLRPGGCLVLEAQKWGSYRKKKKLSEHALHVYKSLQFRPDHFREFLTSKEVGFSSCRFLDVPSSKQKGSSSTIHIFTKENDRLFNRTLASAAPATATKILDTIKTPEPLIPVSMDSAESQSSWLEVGSVKFEIESSSFTPCSTCENSCSEENASHLGTPWTERTCSSVECATGKDFTTTLVDSRADESSSQNEAEKESEDDAVMPWSTTPNDPTEKSLAPSCDWPK